MLHVTNGDSVVASFREGQIEGAYLPWRDVLHDGPVPRSPSLEALSDVRARVIAGPGGAYPEVRRAFAERDRALAGFRSHDETVLWFEHDLYDQLQLLQILNWFSRQDLDGAHISLIQIDRHPEVARFVGLGQLDGRQLRELLPLRKPVTPRQFGLGRDAWEAYCAPDPRKLLVFAARMSDALPFLASALTRGLEEYPSTRDGLSRTERQLLEAGASGARRRREYYEASSAREACPWGDRSVFERLDALAHGPEPALDRIGDDEFVPTTRGAQLLAGSDDWWRGGGHDVWIGGVHLEHQPRWRWDSARRTLIADA